MVNGAAAHDGTRRADRAMVSTDRERSPVPASPASASPPAYPVDLHSHTDESDGQLGPAALVRHARDRGVRQLAITDHDTVAGLAAATAEAARLGGIEVVPGVELSSTADGREVHVLGYFVDPADPVFLARLAELAAGRRTRVERMAARLAALGVPVTAERVFALAGPGTVGRPHVARALVEAGHVASVSEAFDRVLAAGRPGYVPREPLAPEAAVALVLAAGGVPVLAHPLGTGDPAGVVARLVGVGLRGMEVEYGEYPPEARAELRAIADRHGLIPTGGSDFHGPALRPGRDLGGPAVSPETVDRLRALARGG